MFILQERTQHNDQTGPMKVVTQIFTQCVNSLTKEVNAHVFEIEDPYFLQVRHKIEVHWVQNTRHLYQNCLFRDIVIIYNNANVCFNQNH